MASPAAASCSNWCADISAAPQATLYLLDASIYVFRGWHVWSDELQDADGHLVNAVHGFASALVELLERACPSHLVGAFDQSGEDNRRGCARREIYAEYKANRPPAPPELKRQFGQCRALLRACGIAEFASPRYEADDIIATLAGHARAAELPVVVVSADKDLAQLIGERDHWWDLARDRKLDARGVEKHFDVPAECIGDLLALAGDRVDNIPGVPGVGMTTAAKLLRRFGDIDTLYAQLETVGTMKFRGAKRVQGLLAEHLDTVLLSRRLTHLLHDPEVPTDPEALRPRGYAHGELLDLLEHLQLPDWQCERLLAGLDDLPRIP